MSNKSKLFISTGALVLLASCATTKIENNIGVSNEATAESYVKNRAVMGTVLLDAKWGRQWKCGQYENAQLVSFGFDRLPLGTAANSGGSEVIVGTTSQLMAKPQFISIALLIPPGEYALSSFRIKVAESVSKVGYFAADRNHLLRNGKPFAGSFKVAAGETVYIGNFALDCLQEPVLWRYYTQGKQDFQKQLTEYKSNYPFLDVSAVQYRLFDTSVIGRAYELK